MAAKPQSGKTRKTVAEAEAQAPTNGEYQAEQEARAKAQAEAEAAKAEAEAKAAEAKANQGALMDLVPSLQEAASVLESAQTALGNVLHKAEAFIPSTEYSTVQAFAEEFIPEHCGPIWTSSPAYRSLQAARVVESIGADLVGATSVDALTYLHRFTPEARLAVFKAAKGRSRKPKVSRAALVEKGTELYPEQADAKKGPKAGSEAAKGNGKAAQKKAEAETVQGILDAIASIRPDGEEAEESSGPIVKEALGAIGKALQAHVDEYGGDAYSAALSMLTATVDLCDKWTVPVVKAALRFRAEAEAQEAEAVK